MALLFELALFNLAIDSKVRACDLRDLKVQDVSRSGCVMSRAIVKQQKTHQEVHLEITPKTKNLRAIQLLLGHAKLESTIEYLGVEIENALRISESCET